MIGSDDNSLFIRPELRNSLFLNRPAEIYSPEIQCIPNSMGFGIANCSGEEMFEQIKAHCAKNPILFRKVVEWGEKNNPARRLAKEVTKTLSEGRVWVTARIPNVGKGEAIVNSLDNIKG